MNKPEQKNPVHCDKCSKTAPGVSANMMSGKQIDSKTAYSSSGSDTVRTTTTTYTDFLSVRPALCLDCLKLAFEKKLGDDRKVAQIAIIIISVFTVIALVVNRSDLLQGSVCYIASFVVILVCINFWRKATPTHLDKRFAAMLSEGADFDWYVNEMKRVAKEKVTPTGRTDVFTLEEYAKLRPVQK